MKLWSSLSILWHCLSLELEWKLPFSSPVATAEFSKFAGILSEALSLHHLLGFEIDSPPLALFIVMLPKAHLTLHCRMSGSRWVITTSWLSGSWRSFLYSSVYSCHLLLISWNECHILDWINILDWMLPIQGRILQGFLLAKIVLLLGSIMLLYLPFYLYFHHSVT